MKKIVLWMSTVFTVILASASWAGGDIQAGKLAVEK